MVDKKTDVNDDGSVADDRDKLAGLADSVADDSAGLLLRLVGHAAGDSANPVADDDDGELASLADQSVDSLAELADSLAESEDR